MTSVAPPPWSTASWSRSSPSSSSVPCRYWAPTPARSSPRSAAPSAAETKTSGATASRGDLEAVAFAQGGGGHRGSAVRQQLRELIETHLLSVDELDGERGATAVEYALMLAFIAIVIVG